MSSDLFQYSLKQLDELEGAAIALPQFDTETAWRLGSFVREQLVKNFPEKSVTIDISTSSRQVLFRSITKTGSTFDNDEWVRRKINTVLRFGKSSFYIGQQMRIKKKTLEEARFISFKDFCDHGGSVPIRLQNSDIVIGTLTLSGLAQEEDHFFALQFLKEFAKN